ncbi:hypothetical protein EV363DRAFT_1169749 [Boletus edulis]|uniref:Uncharacterized protein n=1 Tax=Boletus edulis BED1 TaxID=1328754 RepID=A0AAD4GLZ5_BOLED|nr:hypothetical protein EV363DRAFT_1169749 [Boletus edulis]KAF8452303.1 hypothetical protein L210DRAFT_958844 [Boletus edulis BED1]
MPTAAHKFSITDFSRVVQPALDRLPINRQRLRVTLEPNLTLRSSLTGFSATPDLALVATPDLALATRPAEGESSSSNLLAVVECAFSQDRNQLMEKVRSEVEGWPGIVLAVVIIVSEACSCHSPLMGSPSWDFFAQHKSCLSPDTFLSLPHSIDECVADTPVKVPSDCLDDSSVSSNVCFDAVSDDSDSDTDGGSEPLVLDPIILAGHKWCDIGDVQYYVWVKKDGILDLDGDHAVGVLYPKIAMVDAEVMIKKGLSAVQSEITQLVARTHKPRSILRKLQGVHLSADFNWSEIQAALKFAARLTAVSRYEKWYHENFRGTKRSRSHDTEYKPSRVESSSSAAFLRPQGGTQPRYSLRPRKQ